MEQLARLEAKIDSLEELRELMRAMRALAATHVQSAQASLDGIRSYTAVIEDAIAEGVTLLRDRPEPPPRSLAGPELLVVIGSEHGFVGGLNDRLLEHVTAEPHTGTRLGLVGRRLEALATERCLSPEWVEATATRVDDVLEVARRVAARIAGAARVTLLHPSYRAGGNYEIETRGVLPLAPSIVERSVGSPPLHHLPPEELLRRLAGEYLLAELTRAVTESFASESGARLGVMEAAGRNIDSRLTHLGERLHSLHQQAITAELLDLVTGVEAASGDDR